MKSNFERTLANGRRYKVVDSGQPYKIITKEYDASVYPTGGYTIFRWSELSQDWNYIDNSPDLESVEFCLKAFSKMKNN